MLSADTCECIRSRWQAKLLAPDILGGLFVLTVQCIKHARNVAVSAIVVIVGTIGVFGDDDRANIVEFLNSLTGQVPRHSSRAVLPNERGTRRSVDNL